MKITLNQIKANHPCTEGYRKILKFLGKTEADNEPLALSVILESNGIMDTVWCFRIVSGYEKEKRLFAVFCLRQIQHLLIDPRSIIAIDVAEQYANGKATTNELRAAYDAANTAYVTASAADYNINYAAYAAASVANYNINYNTNCVASAAVIYVTQEIEPVLEAYLKELLSETEK